jgi:hypothetical protein
MLSIVYKFSMCFIFALSSMDNVLLLGELVTNCPEYVQENTDLVCECFSNPPVPEAVHLWPGYSGTPTLVVRNFDRNSKAVYNCTREEGEQGGGAD